MTTPAIRAVVWIVDLDHPRAPAGEALAAGVTDAEVARAASMSPELTGRRWLRARYATRAVLGAEMGIDPREVDFGRAASGKPHVAVGELRFSVAHSGGVALVALEVGNEIGVDVERVRTGLREGPILARVLGADAERRWALEPVARRTAAFFDEWVRFEAAVKCRGVTVAGSFGADVAAGLTLDRVDVGPGYAAAVALEGAGPPAVPRFTWPG